MLNQVISIFRSLVLNKFSHFVLIVKKTKKFVGSESLNFAFSAKIGDIYIRSEVSFDLILFGLKNLEDEKMGHQFQS